MKAKRTLLSVLFLAILLLAAFPGAQAARPCADILTRCYGQCNQTFGGPFGGILVAGCDGGCSMGYFWCSSSN